MPREEYALADMEERMRVHLRDHYLTLVSILKGVSVAAAVLALGQLASSSESSPSLFVALVYVVTSMGAIILTYEAVLVGTLLLHWRPIVLDVISPFTVGLLEALLFAHIAAISWSGRTAQDLDALSNWCGYFALWGLACIANIVVVYVQSGHAKYDGVLTARVGTYREGLCKRDMRAATVIVAVAAVLWALMRAEVVSGRIQLYVAPAFLLLVVVGIASQEAARRRLWYGEGGG
jgi:hypothetical protein